MVQGNHTTVKLDSGVASRGMKTYSESRIEQQILEKILEIMSSRFLPSEQPCEPKSLDVALNIAGVEKICLENFTVAVNTGDHWIRVLNERNVNDRGNLCRLLLVILKS